MAAAIVNTTTIKAKTGDTDGCPRCGGKVFEAEKMIAGKMTFHKKCFTCEECSRALDSSLLTTGPDQRIYCHNCYVRRFGPTVQQFNEELARRLVEAGQVKSTDPKHACPRCSSTVYPKEELYSNGRSYHKRCAKCATCARQLDFN